MRKLSPYEAAVRARRGSGEETAPAPESAPATEPEATEVEVIPEPEPEPEPEPAVIAMADPEVWGDVEATPAPGAEDAVTEVGGAAGVKRRRKR